MRSTYRERAYERGQGSQRKCVRDRDGGWLETCLDAFNQQNACADSGNVPHFPFSTKGSDLD